MGYESYATRGRAWVEAHFKSLISLLKTNFRIGWNWPIRNLFYDLEFPIFKPIFIEIRDPWTETGHWTW